MVEVAGIDANGHASLLGFELEGTEVGAGANLRKLHVRTFSSDLGGGTTVTRNVLQVSDVQGVGGGGAGGTVTVGGWLTASATGVVTGTVTAVPTGTQGVSGSLAITNTPAMSGTVTAHAGTGTRTVVGTVTAAVTGTQTVSVQNPQTSVVVSQGASGATAWPVTLSGSSNSVQEAGTAGLSTATASTAATVTPLSPSSTNQVTLLGLHVANGGDSDADVHFRWADATATQMFRNRHVPADGGMWNLNLVGMGLTHASGTGNKLEAVIVGNPAGTVDLNALYRESA